MVGSENGAKVAQRSDGATYDEERLESLSCYIGDEAKMIRLALTSFNVRGGQGLWAGSETYGTLGFA